MVTEPSPSWASSEPIRAYAKVVPFRNRHGLGVRRAAPSWKRRPEPTCRLNKPGTDLLPATTSPARDPRMLTVPPTASSCAAEVDCQATPTVQPNPNIDCE